MIQIHRKDPQATLSQKQKENYLRLAEIIKWGRRYPVRFVELFLGIELLDYQKFVFMNSWITPNVVWCQCRGSGKSSLAAPFIMAKTMLIPNYQVHILSGTGDQAKEAFKKIEKICKKQIESYAGVTEVFYNETVKSCANRDGFLHHPNSFSYSLYNGSRVNTLNSDIESVRSRRSNLNFYDEAGFVNRGLFEASEPFLTQSSDFKLGGDSNAQIIPKQFKNQRIYASSASSIDTYFWEKYRDYAKRMFLGDKDYFVADINSDIVVNGTLNGKIFKPPLLTKKVIEEKMEENKEVGLREYSNIFSTEGGDSQIIKRAAIIRNSHPRLPKLCNTTGKDKFVMAYDPARMADNSVCTVAELILDPDVGYRMEICNCVSFVDIAKKKKTPMRKPEQIEHLKQLILDYNGKNPDYENIEALLVDAGAGGGGVDIADMMMEDWRDSNGKKHKGMIDSIAGSDYLSKFPNAIDKLKLMQPQHKVKMFDALVDMVNMDLISFTDHYDMKGYLTIYETKGKGEQAEAVESKHNLSFEEQMALKHIDLAKEELVSIHRFDNNRSGTVTYGLSPDKKNKMHDDRAFCLAMLAWYLHEKRRSHITNKKPDNFSWDDFILY